MAKNQQSDAPIISNMFADLLGRIRDGELQVEASQKLNELVQSVRNNGKPGSISIKIKVIPSGKNRLVVFEADDVAVKLPQEKKDPTYLYQTDDGRLVADNPDQKMLDLREVKRPEGEEVVRGVNKAEEAPRKAAVG